MKRILHCLASISLMVLASCAPVFKVHSDYDKKIDFTQYKSFSFYGFTDKSSGISELNRNRIISAITNEMKEKGFIDKAENPDLYVNASTIVKEKTQVSNTNYYGYGGVYRPYYWGPGYSSGDVNVYSYNEGTLIIDIVDAKKGTLIWTGVGNSEIDVPLKNPDEVIPNAVKKILAYYPPKQSK